VAQDAAQKAWISKVLGVSLPDDTPQPAAREKPAAGPLLPLWIDAKERAGDQIGKLQSALRSMRHPILDRVADQGLNGITGRLQVGLQVALTEFDRAQGDEREKARAKLGQKLQDFRSFLKTDKVLPALEQNPFGVAISLRGDLTAAMDAIEDAANAAGSARQ